MTTTDDARALLPHLLDYDQCDEEGIMCIASRQAVEEAAAALRDLAAERDALREEVARLRGLVSDGLDLCVRGRVIDQHDGNVPLWIVDGYTANLNAWEALARAALAERFEGQEVGG